MPSEKRRKRRARKAEQQFTSARERAAKYGLDLGHHAGSQYSLEWPVSRARWELYPSTHRIFINDSRKKQTPSLKLEHTDWDLRSVVDRAIEILGLKPIAEKVEIHDPDFEIDDTPIETTKAEDLGDCPLFTMAAMAAPSDVEFGESDIACSASCKFRKTCDVVAKLGEANFESFAPLLEDLGTTIAVAIQHGLLIARGN
jgi:hypothetical protein